MERIFRYPYPVGSKSSCTRGSHRLIVLAPPITLVSLVSVTDGILRSRPIMFSLHTAEQTEDLSVLLKHFREVFNNIDHTLTVTIDCAISEPQLVQHAFPTARMVLSSSFVRKVFKRKFKSAIANNIFGKMTPTFCPNKFRHDLQRMKKLDTTVYYYITQDWVPMKEMWVPAFLQDVVTSGTKINGAVKDVHHRVRDALKEHDSLEDCLLALHTTSKRNCDSGTRNRLSFTEDFLNQLTDYASEKTYDDVVRESDVIIEEVKTDSVVCTDEGNSYHLDRNEAVCTCPPNSLELLPCRHLVKVHFSVGLHTGTACRYR
ncbi:unnamed protein product [Heterobilharzia americana]|nr:unnamed protein product [Heterobilharzia americana]